MQISIAMATYNGEKYLREQLNSILFQTYSDFELIVYDDCSIDSTWDILVEYKKMDNRISCYRNDVNIGFLRNFEKAISQCTGKYIALCDQDDVWETNHLEVLVSNIGDNLLCSGNIMVIDSLGG